MSISIKFENVGKEYRLGQIGTGTLCHDLNRWVQIKLLKKPDPYEIIDKRANRICQDRIWALKDFSCEIEKGEILAIIGRNGAGKSTMLKLLSRITAPTCGKISIKGRISSLLEVGTGFHPELTGRENIYFNGALMGLTKRDIDNRLDQIVDFAEIEDYLDTPVKRYSSGMWVRLGFAIAAHLEPDILVVDEVLAVGDINFQRKAIGRIKKEVSGQGRTVLFVSHNLSVLKSLCKRGIVLDRGRMIYDAPISEAIDFYLQSGNRGQNTIIKDAISYQQSIIEIKNIEINGTSSNFITIGDGQEYFTLSISGCVNRMINCSVKLIIMTMDRQPLASFLEGRVKGMTRTLSPGPFTIFQKIRMPRYLAQGDYLIDLYLHEPTRQDFFKAPECCVFHCEGYCQPQARPIILKDEGMFCLESYE